MHTDPQTDMDANLRIKIFDRLVVSRGRSVLWGGSFGTRQKSSEWKVYDLEQREFKDHGLEELNIFDRNKGTKREGDACVRACVRVKRE